MAYPTVSGPYGLKPVNLIGGQVFAGATRQIPIASAYNTNLLNGDLVKVVASGTLEKDAGTTTATPVGVFLGCRYTDPNLGYELYSQYFPANTVASDIVAYVADDPDQLYKVAVVSGTTVIAGVGRTVVGNNMSLVQNAGSTQSGNSKVAVLSSSAATTNTLPIRVIDVVTETASAADTYVELIVKFNWGMHQYQNATGV
jgi:hypothetical protein|tara:strand:- start:372 stop:971 length:600 start_codon:yes stop_codon:yes gene_type:complete